LLGTAAKSLRLVRDPAWLAETLQSAGLPALEVRSQSKPPETDGHWLQKPLASAGGLAIRVWDRKSSRIEFDQPHYFQQYVSGSPMSALFRSIRGQIEFVGMTRQYVALPDSKSPEPFGYCASLGPVDLSETKLVNCVKQIGRVVGSTARLNGLFGIDFLLNDEGVWPVEVNPRYTASVEVLELAMQRPLLAGIAGDADREGRDSLNEFVSSADSLSETNEHLAKVPTPCVAKMILFAPQTLVAPVFTAVLETSSLWRVPDLADIPCPGSVIQTGWPICTVMAEGQTSDDCWSNLIDRVRSIWQRLECV
jgi:predicted ATP-grasp superfamily ATP-dependent carboligase